MGGKTPEHEISLISGKEVAQNLFPEKYNVLPVIISKSGSRWNALPLATLIALPDPLKLKGTSKDIVKNDKHEVTNINDFASRGVDVVFIAMHGPYGEDGTVQGMLELAGIAYTGSGVLASAIGMDKLMFRKLLSSEKLPIPKYAALRKNDKKNSVYRILGKPPYFVKPSDQGSSVGASLARNKRQLFSSLKKAFSYSNVVLVDHYIKGVEVTCGIIGNENPIALPLVEIVPKKGEFFDYESKYSKGGSDEITPARVSKGLTKKIQNLAIKVYKLVGCRGFARVDFILKDKKEPYILEINTIPGLTPMSLIPRAAKTAGMSYGEFLNKIVEYSLE